jgi:hypothetical protein
MAVCTAADRPRAGEGAHGGGDGLALGAHEVGQALMAERQGDDDAVGVDAAPSLGEVPQRQQQAIVDALMVRDRERDGEVVGAPGAAIEQLQAELRPGSDAHDEVVIEDGQSARLENRPSDLRPDVGALVVPFPRSHHIALPDELHAAPPQHLDGTTEQPVDDQEPAMVLRRLLRGRRVPLTGRHALDTSQRLAPRPLEAGRVEQVGQVGIGVDDADDGSPGAGHTGSLPITDRTDACPHSDVAAPTPEGVTADASAYVAAAVSATSVNPSKGAHMLWLIIGVVLLIIAIAGGTIVHPVLFVLAILALLAFFMGGRGRTVS